MTNVRLWWLLVLGMMSGSLALIIVLATASCTIEGSLDDLTHEIGGQRSQIEVMETKLDGIDAGQTVLEAHLSALELMLIQWRRDD